MQNNKLIEIIVQLLASGEPFTDILVVSNMHVVLRQSAYKWVPAKIDGNQVVVPHTQVMEFLDSVFALAEDADDPNAKKRWRKKLNVEGSLHPALNLSTAIDGEPKSFRVRIMVQKQMMGESIGFVVRPLPEVPENLAKLGVPFQVERLLKNSFRGLMIVTGPTGAGKSTTLAAMISELNSTRYGNILTVEDPVEFVHDWNKCIISHREVGIDVNSFADGVRDAQRFVPDVVLIGEIRDADTMRAAVRSAESGQLVLASMHAPTTFGAVRKMLAYLSDSRADMQTLPSLLLGVIAQALVRDKDGSGRNHLASEFLNCSTLDVQLAIQEAAAADGAQQKLGAMEKRLADGSMADSGLPMLAALRQMIEKGLVTGVDAAAAVTTSEEKAELLKLSANR